MAQQVKNLPAVQETQETWVRSLGWGDPLEKEMATHSSILAWKIPWTEEPDGLQSNGSQSQTWLNMSTESIVLVLVSVFSSVFSLTFWCLEQSRHSNHCWANGDKSQRPVSLEQSEWERESCGWGQREGRMELGGWGVDGMRLCRGYRAFTPRKMGNSRRVWAKECHALTSIWKVSLCLLWGEQTAVRAGERLLK